MQIGLWFILAVHITRYKGAHAAFRHFLNTATQENFDQLMKESHAELLSLRMELQNLLVKFGLRALKTYQAARNEPLRPPKIASLVKYEIENAIHDVSEQGSKDAIIKQARQEWEKQHSKEQK